MANSIICAMLGYSKEEILTRFVHDIHPEKDLPNVIEAFERQARNEFRLAENLPVKRKDGTIFYADISSSPISIGTEAFIVGIFRDITERKQADEEREKLIKELQDALENIKTLSGLIPICGHCKKIRDGKGYWSNLEAYIENNSDVLFSHSICTECSDELYGNEDWYLKMKKKRRK